MTLSDAFIAMLSAARSRSVWVTTKLLDLAPTRLCACGRHGSSRASRAAVLGSHEPSGVWSASPAAMPFLGVVVYRPSADCYSWISVPLILVAMGEIKQGGMVEFAAGRRWRGWVDAYREDLLLAARPSLQWSSKGRITYVAWTRSAFSFEP